MVVKSMGLVFGNSVKRSIISVAPHIYALAVITRTGPSVANASIVLRLSLSTSLLIALCLISITDRPVSDLAMGPLSSLSNDQSTADVHSLTTRYTYAKSCTCIPAVIFTDRYYRTLHVHVPMLLCDPMHTSIETRHPAMMGGMLRVRVEIEVTFNVE
jgi:hypothetical protein